MSKNLGTPIKIGILYLFFTLVTYVFIYKENSSNLVLTVTYCSINFLMLYLGYYTIIFSKNNLNNTNEFIYQINLNKVNRIIIISSIMTIIVSINNISTFYSEVPNIWEYLLNPGKAYEYVKFINRTNSNVSGSMLQTIIGVFLNISSFFKYMLVIFLVLYWKKSKFYSKIIGIVAIMFYVLQSFLIGAMINIGILLFSTIPAFIYLKNINSNYKLNLKQKILILFFITAVGVVILYFLGSRNYIDKNVSFLEVLQFGLLGIFQYISQGYHGLSTCFDLDFKFTYGSTMFRGLSETLLPYIGINSDTLFSASYLIRNQEYSGWKALQTWSTIFPWLASDLTFYLVPVLFFFLGNAMKNVWKKAKDNQNPFAILLLGQFMNFIFMIPANNQLFHTFGNAMSTIIIVLLYKISVKKKKIHE